MVKHLCTTKLLADGRDFVHPATRCTDVHGCPTILPPVLGWEAKKSMLTPLHLVPLWEWGGRCVGFHGLWPCQLYFITLAGRGWRWSSCGLGCSSSCNSKTGDHVLPSMLVFLDSSALHLCSISEIVCKIPIMLCNVAQFMETENIAQRKMADGYALCKWILIAGKGRWGQRWGGRNTIILFCTS